MSSLSGTSSPILMSVSREPSTCRYESDSSIWYMASTKGDHTACRFSLAMEDTKETKGGRKREKRKERNLNWKQSSESHTPHLHTHTHT